MKTRRVVEMALALVAGLAALGLVIAPAAMAGESTDTAKKAPAVEASKEKPAEGAKADSGDLEPLPIKLPKAMFEGTPKNIKASPTLEKYVDKNRPPFMAPKGCVNLAAGKPVTASDSEPIIGEIKMATDGDREGTDGSFVELGPGKQWVQIDLKAPAGIYAFLIWHYHGEGRVYHDVVIQVADDPDFIENVRTVYNNDFDNSSGLGIGKDLEYIEDFRGRLIDAKGVKARYIRLYSKGNTSNDQNHYIEVEVWGKQAK
jgi:hypothetical protein